MATFTVSIPEELKKRIDNCPEVNWPEFVKKKFEARIEEFKRFEEFKNSGKI